MCHSEELCSYVFLQYAGWPSSPDELAQIPEPDDPVLKVILRMHLACGGRLDLPDDLSQLGTLAEAALESLPKKDRPDVVKVLAHLFEVELPEGALPRELFLDEPEVVCAGLVRFGVKEREDPQVLAGMTPKQRRQVAAYQLGLGASEFPSRAQEEEAPQGEGGVA